MDASCTRKQPEPYSDSGGEELTFEPSIWEVDDLEATICTCGVPSTENLIQCCGSSCPIAWFHRQCVGLHSTDSTSSSASAADAPGEQAPPPATVQGQSGEESWTCEFCIKSTQHSNNDDIATDTPKDAARTSSKGGENQGNKEIRAPKKKKVKMTPQTTKEAVLQRAADLLVSVFERINSDHFYDGHPISTLAQQIVSKQSTMRDISNKLTSLIWDCAAAGDSHYVGPSMNSAILTQFQEMRCGTEVLAEWEAYLDGAGFGGGKLVRRGLLQFILRNLLHDVVNLRNGCEVSGDEEQSSRTLTKEGEGVLRLIAGFIPFALIKKYAKVKSPLGQKFKEFLLTWKVVDDDDTEADSFLAYTSVWVTHQNRGGLFKVSDQVFKFFRAVEFVVMKQLNVFKLVGNSQSAKDILDQEIRSSSFVERSWAILISKHLTREESDALFTTVINYYIKIRLKNFVKLYVNLKKREQAKKASKKGEKGLRKELKKATKK